MICQTQARLLRAEIPLRTPPQPTHTPCPPNAHAQSWQMIFATKTLHRPALTFGTSLHLSLGMSTKRQRIILVLFYSREPQDENSRSPNCLVPLLWTAYWADLCMSAQSRKSFEEILRLPVTLWLSNLSPFLCLRWRSLA